MKLKSECTSFLIFEMFGFLREVRKWPLNFIEYKIAIRENFRWADFAASDIKEG